MAYFGFIIEKNATEKGSVQADSIDEAKQKIKDGDWLDSEEVDDEYGDIIDIWEE